MSIIKENKYKTNGLNCLHIEMKLIQNSFTNFKSCCVPASFQYVYS